MGRNKLIVLILVIIGMIGGRIIFQKFIPGPGPSDRLAAAVAVELDRQGLSAPLSAKVATIKDPTEARSYGAELGRRGLARLSAAQLVTRAELLLHLDSMVGDTLCAARFMGTLQGDAMIRYVGLLDSARLASWAELAAASMKAEFEATTPMTPPTREEIGAALQLVTANASEADRPKLRGVLANVAGASIGDQCWTSKTVAATVLGMPEPQREDVLRKLAKVEAGL